MPDNNDTTASARFVPAADGTPLAVSQVGSPDADLTVIFSHGFCLTADIWSPQRRHLCEALGTSTRLVFYDHRGHGRSHSPQDCRTYTLGQLGDDLNSVITATTAGEPVILVGHSMGGMTVLSFAARHPESLTQVTGLGLISTAAGGLHNYGIGRALGTPALPLLRNAARTAPELSARIWALARTSLAPLMGIPLPPSAAAATTLCRTPIAAIAELLNDFRSFDQTSALDCLAHIPALIACGLSDPITPITLSQNIAKHLPLAEKLFVAGAGHMLGVERPQLISHALARLIARSRSMAADNTHARGIGALAGCI